MASPFASLPVEHLARVSASDHIAEMLRDAIVGGLLPSGEVLRQDEIAARFDVSKIPVREALKRLEAEGLVTFIRNRGAIVASLSMTEIGEYVEIRALLEENAARQAAARISERSLALAGKCLAEFDAEVDTARWGELNWRFHASLYVDAGRPILLAEIRSLYDKVERYLRTLLAMTREMPKTRREHAEILAAFVRRDPEAAASLTRAHVLDAGSSLVNYLNERGKGETA